MLERYLKIIDLERDINLFFDRVRDSLRRSAMFKHLLWLGLLLSAATASGTESLVVHSRAEEFSLHNGLRVIVQVDHRAPVVVVQVWYKVGGSYELDGATGVSHALEHMMFKRTRHLVTGEYSKRIAASGGQENAFTTADYTTYYEERAAGDVDQALALEAERMQSLELDPVEFANEIKVIREERRLRTEDNAQAMAMEAIQAHTWQTSPYRQPVIGWSADIAQMKLTELRRWYKRYYAPNNAILVVVGDVTVAAIKEMAQTHFGAMPAHKPVVLKTRPEVVQSGLKRLTITSPKLRLPRLVMNYKVPGLTQVGKADPPVAAWEIYALYVLAATLDGGASARFERELVRGQEIALGANATYTGAARLPDLFTLEGEPREGISLEQLEAALKAQLEAVQNTPPTAKELARIKTGVVADAVYQQDSLFGQAMRIGGLAVIGLDWHLEEQYVANIQAVTSAQVQAVARKYFKDDSATIAYLTPGKAHE